MKEIIIDSKFLKEVDGLLEAAKKKGGRIRNYWLLGQLLVKEERAKNIQDKVFLSALARDLKEKGSSKISRSHLRYIRNFYLYFPNWKLAYSELSWSHYLILMTMEEKTIRTFYLEECLYNHWSAKVLSRQINSFYYERLHTSNNPEQIDDISPQIIKDTYVLEFLEVPEEMVERDLEDAILDKLQQFLLELGRGFAFVARQKRIVTETGKNFYIDLVFYHFILKCFVLVDLKKEELSHRDIGQMDMYVRLYEDKWRKADDQPTLGIILCSEKDQTIVKYSVLNGSRQLYASRYQLFLPTELEINEFLAGVYRTP